MQQVQFTRGWRKLSLALAALLAAAVIVVWTKPTPSVSTPVTVGAAGPVEGSAISPMELMIRRGGNLPAADYVEPF